MARVVTLVHHDVADFEAWKLVYDGVRELQRGGGVRSHGVYRSRVDPNSVVVMHAFDTHAEADAFFSNPQLEQALADAGVDLGSLRIEYLDEIASGDL